MKRRLVVLVLILGHVSASAAQQKVGQTCLGGQFFSGFAKVDLVKDGDTLLISNPSGAQASVRLGGLDTPETFFKGKHQGPWAFRAKDRLRELLPPGTQIRLEFDRRRCDARGRLLVHAFVGGVHINRVMVEEGWAVNYCVAPNFQYCAELGDLAARNERESRGFLGDATVQIPYLYREEEREGDFEYHVGDIETKLVAPSSSINLIPIGRRVLFYSSRYIQPPYVLAPKVSAGRLQKRKASWPAPPSQGAPWVN